MTRPLTLVDPRPLLDAAGTHLAGLGLRPGDRVATVTGQDLEGFALGWACALAGIVQVPLPGDLPGPGVGEVLDDALPVALLALDPSGVAVAEARSRGLAVHPVTSDRSTSGATAAALQDAPRTRAMAYTSGTTGRRRGVHVGVHATTWGRVVLDDEAAAFDHLHGERHLVVSPLYHSGPFRHALVTADAGGRVAVLPRFDVELLVTALRRLRPTSLFCVPTHLHRLLAHPDLRADDLASLQLLVHAGAPCPVPLKERVHALAPAGAVWEFYGSTEGQFTVCPPEVAAVDPHSVGHARPGRRLEVRDDDGHPVPSGTVGTVWSSAPRHARFEYWQDPLRTAAAWDGDAFTVHDLGRLDAAGRLTLVGRPGDLVITGGVNVYPAEVERELLALDGVGEAVAFGVQDDDWGQRLVAAVTARDVGVRLVADELLDALRTRLPAARVPKQVLVVSDLPRTPTGKVLRTALPDLDRD